MAFRIEPVFRMPSTLRVLHGPGEHLALALIDLGEDGSATLFPVQPERLPGGMDGTARPFGSLSEVFAFLGIEPEARAA